MKRTLAILSLALVSLGADWQTAEPGWRYEFPRDHHAHGSFKTEWWYFTGNLFADDGKRIGYELTFFRQGIRPLAERDPQLSRFVVGDLKFAHFTITDVAKKEFRFLQKTSRGAFGEAGFDDDARLAWIDDWTVRMTGENEFELSATLPETTLRLHLRATKPPTIHGLDGISQKAAETGHASHYYSLTRMETTGEIVRSGERRALRGESWFDHEWATNQLAPGQAGWDWLSVQFADGSELMLYRMRRDDGTMDASSSGTLIAPDGTSTHLPRTAFTMTAVDFWKSEKTGANYPIGWRVEVPAENLQFDVRPLLKNQELALLPLVYWEGAIDVIGARDGNPTRGHGYLELTGYSAPLRELQR